MISALSAIFATATLVASPNVSPVMSGLSFVDAASAPSVADDPQFRNTRAGEIAVRFNQSRAAFPQAVRGWHSGRCYHVSDPNRPYGNLLVTETRMARSGDGPIFDREVTKMVVLNHTPGSQNPEFFDHPSYELTRNIERFIDGVFRDPDYSEAYQYEGSLSASWSSRYTRWDQRADDRFQYVRIVNTTNGRESEFCYFFKKLR